MFEDTSTRRTGVARRTVSGVVKKASASGIDLDKLRAALRRLGDEYIFYILDALIDVVPPAELERRSSAATST